MAYISVVASSNVHTSDSIYSLGTNICGLCAQTQLVFHKCFVEYWIDAICAQTHTHTIWLILALALAVYIFPSRAAVRPGMRASYVHFYATFELADVASLGRRRYMLDLVLHFARDATHTQRGCKWDAHSPRSVIWCFVCINFCVCATILDGGGGGLSTTRTRADDEPPYMESEICIFRRRRDTQMTQSRWNVWLYGTCARYTRIYELWVYGKGEGTHYFQPIFVVIIKPFWSGGSRDFAVRGINGIRNRSGRFTDFDITLVMCVKSNLELFDFALNCPTRAYLRFN